MIDELKSLFELASWLFVPVLAWIMYIRRWIDDTDRFKRIVRKRLGLDEDYNEWDGVTERRKYRDRRGE